MQFQVPQFIEVEDTIFGPLTFKQFLYLAGGAGLCFIIYVYLPIYLAIIPIIAVAGLAVALAFYKYNGRNFIFTVESATKFLLSKKLYLWEQAKEKSDVTKVLPQKTEPIQPEGVGLPKLSASKLKDLSWSLDVRDKGTVEETEEDYGH